MRSQHDQNPTNDDLDRMLDAALAKYAAVEPRTGLEERILANLRAEQTQPAPQAWWQWSLVATAILVIVAVLAWKWSKPSTPQIVRRRPAVLEPAQQRKEVVRRDAPEKPRQKLRPQVVDATRERSVAQAFPKLDQFPSPQPLSEQEKLLAMYISQDPERAALIAEARMETLRQDEAEKLRMTLENSKEIGR